VLDLILSGPAGRVTASLPLDWLEPA